MATGKRNFHDFCWVNVMTPQLDLFQRARGRQDRGVGAAIQCRTVLWTTRHPERGPICFTEVTSRGVFPRLTTRAQLKGTGRRRGDTLAPTLGASQDLGTCTPSNPLMLTATNIASLFENLRAVRNSASTAWRSRSRQCAYYASRTST